MSIIDYTNISNSKIKFRFAEPYASEAANIQMGVNLPGAYRGAIVSANTTPDDKFLIKKASGDTDSIVLHRDSTTGVCTVVRETLDIELDCSGLSFPPGVETTLYVYMAVDYDDVPQTSGKFEVSDDSGDIPTDAVMLAHIILPSDATVIEQEYIKTDGSKRNKVDRKRGLIVLRRQDQPTTGLHRTGFEIEDRVCWLSSGSSPQNRVRLGDDGMLNGIPLVGSDGGQIVASSWYDHDGGTLLSLSDMDEDGCYTNPWVSMSFNDTVDTYNTSGFSVWYWAYVPFDEMNADEYNAGFFETHTNSVTGKTIDGDPDSISNGQLDDQLEDMLSLINSRVSKYDSTLAGGSSDWHLMWRSNNVVDDADVDNDTMSLYWCDTGMLLAQGGYIDGNDFKVDAAGATGSVSILFLVQRKMYFVTGYVSSVPFSDNIYGSSSWVHYKISDGNSVDFFNDDFQFDFREYAKAIMRAEPDTSGAPKFMEILRLADGNIRVYWGGDSDTDNNELLICWGCSWNNTSSEWEKTSSASFDARAIVIGRNNIALKRKATTDSDYLTGWSNWTGTFSFDSILRISGSVVQKFIVPFKAILSEDMIRGMRDTNYNGPTINEVMNLNFRRNASPAGSITWTQLGSGSLSDLQVVDSDPSYIHVTGDLDITSYLTSPTLQTTGCFVNSTSTIYTTDDIPLAVGQSIAVRGTVNGSWIVKSITWNSPGMDIVVEDEDGNNSLPDGNAAGNTAYVLDPSDAGKEIIAFYTAEFSF
jgi:hypothetical protein